MLMKELEGTGNRVRSRLYSYLLAASWDVIDYNDYSEEPHMTLREQYNNLTLQQVLDKLNIQRPEEIKQFRCLGDGTVAELKKLLKETE
nr:MAG TPA: hypothetical protein [Caudoviricetes sp.]